MPDLETLLSVQEHDTNLDRLRHRRESLPERAELVGRLAEVEQLEARADDLRARRDEVLAEERRLDGEVNLLEERSKEIERTMYSGSVTSPRELQAMQADVQQIDRHRGNVEERELERMEEREGLEAELADLEASRREVAADVERLRAAVAAAEAQIDGDAATERSARDELATKLSASLLADYEARRSKNRGVGAARLVGATCQGCRLSIPATEVDRIRRATDDVVSYCDNCGCILVPT